MKKIKVRRLKSHRVVEYYLRSDNNAFCSVYSGCGKPLSGAHNHKEALHMAKWCIKSGVLKLFLLKSGASGHSFSNNFWVVKIVSNIKEREFFVSDVDDTARLARLGSLQ